MIGKGTIREEELRWARSWHVAATVMLCSVILIVVLSSEQVYRIMHRITAPFVTSVPTYAMSVSLRLSQPAKDRVFFIVGDHDFLDSVRGQSDLSGHNDVGVCVAPNNLIPEIAACLQRMHELKVTQPVLIQFTPDRWQVAQDQQALKISYQLDPRPKRDGWVDRNVIRQQFMLVSNSLIGFVNSFDSPGKNVEQNDNYSLAQLSGWSLVAQKASRWTGQAVFVSNLGPEWLDPDSPFDTISIEDLPARLHDTLLEEVE